MANVIGAVTTVTSNFLEINQVSIDNWTFKLFYKFTTVYLVTSSVLSTAKQFFGSPIQCDAGSVSKLTVSYVMLHLKKLLIKAH